MRISEERQNARKRITLLEIAIFDAIEEIGTNVEESSMAMLHIMTEWNNKRIIEENPNPKE